MFKSSYLFKKGNFYAKAYFAIGLLFLVWILFLDSHAWLVHLELNEEIDQLKQRKEKLKEEIKNDKLAIEQLQNIDSLEKYARENYGHKREDEKVFIVE
jgi:cell division protein FtsB